jgi:hypothetical protein
MFPQQQLNFDTCRDFVLEMAFPNDQHSPSQLFQPAARGGVTRAVAENLLRPISGIRFRDARSPAASVPMPKASMYENSRAAAGNRQVGFSGQVGAMKPIAITEATDYPANDLFWSSVP